MPNSRRVLLAVALVAMLFGAQLALLAWERSDPDLFGARDRIPATPSTSYSPPPTDEVQLLSDRPDYWELRHRAEDMRDRYRDEPASADPDYHRAFLYLLADQLGAMGFEANRGGTARQHERTLRERQEKIEELERRYLNNEPLGSEMRIHRPDGTVFEHDGRPPTPS